MKIYIICIYLLFIEQFTNAVRTIKDLFLNESSSMISATSITLSITKPSSEFQWPTFETPADVNSIISSSKFVRRPWLSNFISPVSPLMTDYKIKIK